MELRIFLKFGQRLAKNVLYDRIDILAKKCLSIFAKYLKKMANNFVRLKSPRPSGVSPRYLQVTKYLYIPTEWLFYFFDIGLYRRDLGADFWRQASLHDPSISHWNPFVSEAVLRADFGGKSMVLGHQPELRELQVIRCIRNHPERSSVNLAPYCRTAPR